MVLEHFQFHRSGTRQSSAFNQERKSGDFRYGKSVIALALILTSLACSPAPAADLTPRQRGDLAIQARAILRKYCHECHGQKSVSFDALEYSQLTSKDHPVPFVNLDNPTSRSQIIEFIEDGSMPPGGRKRPRNDETGILKKWIGAKAPRYPKAFDDPSTLQVILNDCASQKSPANVRYLSLAHRIRDDQEFKSLETEEFQLQQALDAATTKEKSVALQPIDDAATIFLIDIEKLGWMTLDLFEEIDLKGKGGNAHPIIPYDLILLENPFPIADARFDTFFVKQNHVRPAPFLRGDWLADVLAPGSPLAADLKSLVELDAAMKKGGNETCGPKVRAFEKPKTGVEMGSPNPPITAWYGPERSDPFKLEFTLKGKQSPFIVRVGDPLPFEVTSDREAKFVLLNVFSDGSVRVLPVANGTVLKKNEPRLLEPNAGKPLTISSILNGAETATEHFILIAAEGGVPVPIFVRSKHATFDCPKDCAPIWRFVSDNEKFDPSKAARTVIEVKVTRK